MVGCLPDPRADIYPKRIQKYYIRQFTLLPTKQIFLQFFIQVFIDESCIIVRKVVQGKCFSGRCFYMVSAFMVSPAGAHLQSVAGYNRRMFRYNTLLFKKKM